MFQHGCSVPLLAQRAFFSTGAYFSFRGFDRSPNVCKEGLPFCRSVFLHASNKFCWRLLRLYASLCMQGTCKTHAETFPRAFIRLTQTHRDHLSSGPASLGLVALAGHARSWCCSYGNAIAVQCPAGLPDLRARLPNRYRASFTRWLVIQQFNLFELIEMSSAQCSLVRLVKSFYQRNS